MSAAAEHDEKVDVYSLGLILLEMSSVISTTHEKLINFSSVKENRELPSSSNLAGTSEGDLIMLLTQVDPALRPSAEQIRDIWLPKWSNQIFGPSKHPLEAPQCCPP